ncbi:MSHA biogenesis protein MshO [Methylohalomonas lacus]|uniref:MSHA biogenesis protein MshO n=1 Tax=Methylohalomonas lacus TaxID=398773 RepID=A0AAE3HN60_9GAMM|nr:prepilin-type N-terminal cleavage/methylation domain-containing protein [Methylohalomonas lacus]MCS3904488.1 MSHA biogenesis protein MshO [Methylohalomonas lacus]
MFRKMAGRNRIRGFTLIELIIVILLIGILAGVVVTILYGPVRASFDIQDRAELVDIAETALQRMTREIRLALPNSIRITGSNQGVEFLRTADGGRYRADPPPGNLRLRFNNSPQGVDGEFEVLGGLLRVAALPDCAPLCLLVIYNTGQPGANAYNGDNSANIQGFGSSPTTIDFQRPSGTGFPYESPQQRFQIVDTPVSFICDPGTGEGEVTRFDNYAVDGNPAAGNANLLIDKVTACNFSYQPGSATRSGLVSIRLTIEADNGQSIELFQQAHVDNQP